MALPFDVTENQMGRASQTNPRHCFEPQELADLARLLGEQTWSDGLSIIGEPNKSGRDASRLDAVRKKLESHGPLRRIFHPDEPHPADEFFVLSNRKRVSVSPEGNREVGISTEAMAIRDGVSSRIIGGIVWRKEMPTPKWRMEPMIRRDPLGRGAAEGVEWKVLKNEKNALAFELLFKPPLRVGEMVGWGFYVWNRRHYAMTRSDAEGRYRDKWVREGVAVRGPTDWLQITVQLPNGFRVQSAHLEKDPILNEDGPNVPGTKIQKVGQRRETLETALHCPESGRYFLSWIPPEQWRLRRDAARFYYTE